MKIDRKWIVMVALSALLLAPACAKKPEPEVIPPPPPVTEKAPMTDVEPDTGPAGPVDPVEKKPEMSLQEAQEMFEEQGLLGDVFFDFDKYDLRPEARDRLAKNAEFMKGSGKEYTFTIEGHCDERGTNEYNIALGQSRSTTAMDYITSLGVDRNRFKTISFGEERPFCTESTEGCWQKNRRARFVITGRS